MIERDPVYRAAADWLLRLHGSALSVEETLEWETWLRDDPRHARAFKRVERAWRTFGAVSVPRPDSISELRRDSYDGGVPIQDWLAAEERRLAHGWQSRRRRTALGVSFIAGCGALLAFVYQYELRWIETKVIETPVGHVLTEKLWDGSVLELAGRSRVEVRYDRRHRRVTLVHGEAFFVAAQDLQRPFTVDVGATSVTAIGTEFNVVRNSDRVVVAVTAGRVAVQRQANADHGKVVDAGQRVVIDARAIQAPAVTALAGEWRTGRLAFENEPLRYVLEDVNRYASKPIVLASDAAGDLKVTGTVAQSNIAGWIASLSSALGIKADMQPERIVLRRD